MSTPKRRLLIHHHAPAYSDAQGIYVQSFIACWVKALSPYFQTIGLLLPDTPSRTAWQDTPIDEPNVLLHRLPMGGRRRDYFKRKKQIREACQAVSPAYDLLLVRGLTPRQWMVWQHCHVPKKAFLLVGSLRENKPKFGLNPPEFLTWALNRVRRSEFKKIAQEGILLANSPILAQEIKDIYGKDAAFVPTNTIRREQLRPLALRPVGKPVKLLYCGRVVADKGIEHLIEALPVLNSGSRHEFQLTVLGAAENKYKTRLLQLAERHGVAGQISWEGFVPFGERLLAYYEAADFMVLPSYHEGFPHCIWEAAICSTPVLATRAGGIPGLMDASMLQFIEMRSASDIARQLNTLLGNPEQRWEKVRNLHRFSQGYTVEAGAKALSLSF